MYTFTAHRISSDDNILYPDILRIDDKFVVLKKWKVFGYQSSSIPRQCISGISIDAHLFFADIIIFSNGEASIKACGFTKNDAQRIRNLLALA